MLVTGTTGSGKSTTLAALIDHINKTRSAHVMTVEDPIEFLHRDNKSIVNQREVAVDTRVVRAGAAQRAAAGSRRHPRRRDARLRDDRDRPARRRDRPPRVLDAAHARRDRDDQPHHRGLSAAPAEAGPAAAGQRAQGRHLAAPDAEGRRQGPRAGGRGDDQHRLHPRLHRRQGEDAPDPRRDRRRHVAVRDADVRPVDLRPVPAGARLLRGSAALGEQRRRVQAEGAGHLDDRPR